MGFFFTFLRPVQVITLLQSTCPHTVHFTSSLLCMHWNGCWPCFLAMSAKSYTLMRKTEVHEGAQTIELEFGLKQTNKPGVKTAWASSRWFGYLSTFKPQRNEPLMSKQRLGLASGRFGFVFRSVIQQKKGSILRCRLPPSLWTAFVYWQISMGVQTLLSASLGSLYNVLIDFSLGITDDTSALARVKKDLPHLSL